jgi:signal transduction histidine kinase/CheY-like chemotaxis protein/AraC-like DNA-binding protein
MKNNLLLIFCLIDCVCYSQSSEIELSKEALVKSKNFLLQLEKDSAYFYALKSFELANNTTDKKLQSQANTAMANALYRLGNKDEAYVYGQKAIELSNTIKDAESLMDAYLIIGNIHYFNLEDSKAISYYQKIDSMSSQFSIENATVVKALEMVGLLLLRGYEYNGEDPILLAEKYFQKAHELAKIIGDKIEEHVSGSYLAATLIRKKVKEYDKALLLYDEAYNYFKATNNKKELASMLWAYSSLYRDWGKFELAEKYYLENIQLNSISGDINGLARAHFNYATFHDILNNFNKAATEYEKAIQLFKQEKNLDLVMITAANYNLSEDYFKLKNFEKAHYYLKEFKLQNDTLTERQNLSDFTDAEAKYQAEKKQKEIELLTTENKLAAANQAKQRNLFVGLFFIFLSGGGALFYAYRNKIKTAEKLKEINQLKSRFFANISHEFRTPLTLITSPLQSLQSTRIDEEQKQQLHLIEVNSNRMLELVNQLLELSKIDSGSLNLILKQGDIPSFIHSILEPFTFHAHEKNLRLKSAIEQCEQAYYFDKDIIEKIVTNLLTNAFKYTPENEEINFSSSIIENQLHLVVANTGSELTEKDLPKLFERFYQKNENQQGIGIGLALVKELVELYQGKIETSIAAGVLRFSVILPLQMDSSNAVLVKTEIEDRTSTEANESINSMPILLVIDDNPEIRKVLSSIFSSTFQVLEAADGEKGLLVAQKEIPDCIISDVMMPIMDGLLFTKSIKENELTSFIPVILLTAKTSDEAHLDALKSTADSFLTKPFNHAILKETVNQLIQERKKLQQRYSKELILKPLDIVINSIDERFLDKLQQLINEQISNPEFSAEEFADKMGMGKMQLYRKLKSLIGLSITEYLRSERLKAAAALLKKGNGNISEIAYSVGFNDLSYFSKCFKEMYHCSPSEFSKREAEK